MNTAHQPGSEPLQIPEQIPNPAVRPAAPEPKPDRREPVELPENAPANRAFKCSLHAWKRPNETDATKALAGFVYGSGPRSLAA
jgi:hypothetical protein